MTTFQATQLFFNIAMVGWVVIQNRGNHLVQAQIETLRELWKNKTKT